MKLCFTQAIQPHSSKNASKHIAQELSRPPITRPVRDPSLSRQAKASLAAVAVSFALVFVSSPAAGSDGLSLRDRLREYSIYQSLFSSPSSPTQRLLGRVQTVQDVLQRVELLVRLRQYDAARSLLRARDTNLLVLDLGYAAEAYRLLPQQAGRQLAACIESLRSALAAAASSTDEDGREEQEPEALLERIKAAAEALRMAAEVLETAGE